MKKDQFVVSVYRTEYGWQTWTGLHEVQEVKDLINREIGDNKNYRFHISFLDKNGSHNTFTTGEILGMPS